MTDWRETRPRDFDTEAADVELTLTIAPDPLGTIDMLTVVSDD